MAHWRDGGIGNIPCGVLLMPDLSRRSLITGLISLVAAPAIVRAGSLMPVKLMMTDAEWEEGVGVYRASAAPEFDEIRWVFPAFIRSFDSL